MKPAILLFILSLCAANSRAQQENVFPLDSGGHVLYHGVWKIAGDDSACAIYFLVRDYILHRCFQASVEEMAEDPHSLRRLTDEPKKMAIAVCQTYGNGDINGDTLIYFQYSFYCFDNMLVYRVHDFKYFRVPNEWGKLTENTIPKYPFEDIMNNPHVQWSFNWANEGILKFLAGLKYYINNLKLLKESDVDIGYLNQK